MLPAALSVISSRKANMSSTCQAPCQAPHICYIS